MGPVLKMLTWTAIVALPGGLLLLPVVLADHMAKKRARQAVGSQAVETQAMEIQAMEIQAMEIQAMETQVAER